MHAHDERLAFLNTLVRTFPRKPREAVLDNSSTHSTQVKRRREPRVRKILSAQSAQLLSKLDSRQRNRVRPDWAPDDKWTLTCY